jgi:phage terminase large subunit-like protein
VVSIDPAGTANARSDETGIVVVGWSAEEKKAYVLADHTGKYSPAGWGTKAWKVHQEWMADAIVAEKNYGQDMVTYVIDNETDNLAKVIGVQSRRGKQLRAEPMVAQYEKGNIIHLRDRTDIQRRPGDLMDLEEEMLSWVPGQGPSPNRVDALVHGLTELFTGFAPATVANPNQILGGPRTGLPPNIPPRRNNW